MAKSRILVVDDEADARVVLQDILERADYEVTLCPSGEAAVRAVQESPFDLLLTDLRMPGMDGIQVLESVREIQPELVAIILTGYGTIETAVRAMRAGAYEYLTKPFKVDEVLLVVRRALEFRNLQRENKSLRRQLRRKYRFVNFLGTSEAMQRVYALIEKVADSDSTVLIYGESGTGKELAARTIHYNSPRRDHPLIPVNCGAIPEDLLESEMFGHERGAFTGATAMRMGRFELADGGTIFLDEIGDMSPALQVKLLRILQEKSFERVGGTKTIHVDIRVLAATNQDLEKAVAERRFREDLYYRLNVIPIHLPSLRERRVDIPLLVDHFLRHFTSQKRREVEGISPEVIQILMEYPWPGNVRELENLIERMVILKGKGTLVPEDLPEKYLGEPHLLGATPEIRIPEDGIDFDAAVEDFENSLILQALQKAGGIKNKAAQYLRLNRTTLVEKIKRKNLEQYFSSVRTGTPSS